MITLNDETIEQPNANQTLTCTEMFFDGIKAGKATCDPVSDAVACLAGTLCCVATAVAQAEENKKPATRGDVVYAKRRRQNDATEMGCFFAMGACIGDTLIDTLAITLGSPISCIRASVLSFFGNNQKENTVFGLSRDYIEQVDLFSSCRPVTSCCDDTTSTNEMTM